MALYARMSFNNNGWITPSGHIGKAISKCHEHIFGFGFEEWFFHKREFKDEKGKKCTLAYLDPLRNFEPDIHSNNELVLYTFERIPNATVSRFIVARKPAKVWRLITHERYLKLREFNINSL